MPFQRRACLNAGKHLHRSCSGFREGERRREVELHINAVNDARKPLCFGILDERPQVVSIYPYELKGAGCELLPAVYHSLCNLAVASAPVSHNGKVERLVTCGGTCASVRTWVQHYLSGIEADAMSNLTLG